MKKEVQEEVNRIIAKYKDKKPSIEEVEIAIKVNKFVTEVFNDSCQSIDSLSITQEEIDNADFTIYKELGIEKMFIDVIGGDNNGM